MRHILIDTDTASDDAVALLMALREPSVIVEAITVVAGNCALSQCVKNALNCVEMAGTYQPPVYVGMGKPLLRKPFHSLHIHGEDGMGNINLSTPQLSASSKHAVDAIIDCAHQYSGKLEIVTIGPLTDLAMAIAKAPEIIPLIKQVVIMGGSGLQAGNITPLAEFNFFADAEAADIVLQSGLSIKVIGWEVGMGEAFINEQDIEILQQLGRLGQFAVRCNQILMEFNAKRTERKGFDLPDPTAVAIALYPEIITDSIHAFAYCEHKSDASYGHFVIDATNLLKKKPNVTVVTAISATLFKQKLFELLAD